MSQVSDYDIANASGASVRSDINLVLDAVKTLNSGSSDPTNAVAFMLYGDTSDNILKIRNSANSSFTEIGDINQANLGLLPIDGSTAMTGALQLRTTGSATNLPVKFDSDDDTGFGRFAENTLSFVCSGLERLKLTTTLLELGSGVDLKFKNGSVGIKFEYNGGGNVNFALPVADGANGSVLQTDGSGQLSFVAIQGVPTGTIFCFAIATVPAGYLECNGQSTAGHAALAALIGSNVPDLRGEFVRGWASNRAVDTGRQIGSTQGDDNKSHNHTVTSNHNITDNGHRHSPTSNSPSSSAANGQSIAVNDNIVGNYGGGSGTGLGPLGNRQFMNNATTGISISTNNTVSNSGGTESRPRNVALMYIIKT